MILREKHALCEGVNTFLRFKKRIKKRDFWGSKWPIALCPLAVVIQLLHNSVKKTVLVNNSILISCVAYRGMVS